MEDYITRRQRIGYSSLWRTLANAVGLAGLITMFAMILATCFFMESRAKAEAHIILKNQIYESIR